jgi:hypothetical protein
VLSAVDGVDEPDAVLHTAFTAHRRCFDAYVALPGYYFPVAADSTARPTLILVNGRDGLDQMMSFGTAGSSAQEQQIVAWRSRPYGITDPFDLFKAVEQYRLGDLTQQITTPVFVADPEDEQFWPGQAERLYNALPGSKILVKFTAAEGAERHCEQLARTLFKQRAFDWLDDTMARS